MTRSRASIIFIFSFILIFYHVKAQESVHPSLPLVIGILALMFSLTFLILAYVKFCNTPANDDHLTVDQAGLFRSISASSGIDKKLIQSLPFFHFSSLKGSKKGLECVVCLSKFEDIEVLRLLPKCKHAFHLVCIDKWLERHSSCPLCRYKFDASDLRDSTYTNSFRSIENPFDFQGRPSFEVFIQREEDRSHVSPKYNFGSTSGLWKSGRFKGEGLLVQENENEFFHKFKHRIIVSDIIHKSRWSDVKSSDLVSLNSEMIKDTSSKRLSPGWRNNHQFLIFNRDLERERFSETKFGDFASSNLGSTSIYPSACITEMNPRFPRSNSVSALSSASCSSSFQEDPRITTSNLPLTSGTLENQSTMSRLLSKPEKRSMSEIVSFSRFKQYSSRNRTKESFFYLNANNGETEKLRSLWFRIAKCTIQRFASQGRDRTETEGHPSNRIRYPQDLSNLSDNQNLHEIYVERNDENIIHENSRKFSHKIVVRDFVDRLRWSNVRSSDLLLLKSEMINYSSSKRFSPTKNILKSKSDTKLARSVSDRAVYTTSREFFVNNNYKMEESLLNENWGKDEKMKRLWYSLARRTIQLFSSPQEKISKGNTIPPNV